MPGKAIRHPPKERRQAQHIEESYEQRGIPEKEAKRRAWATVNKLHRSGEKSARGTRKT